MADSRNSGSTFNSEVCELRHSGIDEKIDKLEEGMDLMIKPEDGTLAKVKQDIEKKIDKLDSKMNAVIAALISTMIGLATSALPALIRSLASGK